MDIRQQSTHTIRNRSKNKIEIDLEEWLRDWGAERATPIHELATPCRTSLKTVEEMRPKRLVNKPPDKMPLLHDDAPMWLKVLVYELLSIWKKQNFQSSKIAVSKAPSYMPHYSYSRINKAVGMVHDSSPLLWAVLVMRYELNYTWQRVEGELGIPKRTYYHRLKQAKKRVLKHLQTLH